MFNEKKLLLALGCVLIGCFAMGQAEAVDLFSDGFESGDFGTGGWTTQNSDAAVKERAANTGTYGAEAAKVTWIEKAISTVGYETIHVKYYRQTKGFDSGENLYVEWFDGSSWNPLETVQKASYGDGLQDKVCGAGADENAGFKIRFRTNGNKVNEYAFIDDVVISGTATAADTDPPTPDPMTWATPPYSTGTSSIAMVATTATDASGVEYYFQCTSGGGNDSGWQDSTSYEDTGLAPDTQYCYTV
ncbi:MAG: hypothetical protein ACYSW4_08350, partial [Planctomycetota bacterium]